MMPFELAIFATYCVGFAGAPFIYLLGVAAWRLTSTQRVAA